MKITNILALVLSSCPASFALASVERDVSDCEVYVDDFSKVGSGHYGSGESDLVANLVVRSDLRSQVVEAGAYFHASGKYYVVSLGNDATVPGVSTIVDNEDFMVPGERSSDGKVMRVAFRSSWNHYDNNIGERTVKDFAYYVTVRTGDTETRYWLKDHSFNFSGEAISESRYFYSESIFLGGYSSGRYLWRDSGSPLFWNRSQCLGR